MVDAMLMEGEEWRKIWGLVAVMAVYGTLIEACWPQDDGQSVGGRDG